jgi:serine/threonine protein kinase
VQKRCPKCQQPATASQQFCVLCGTSLAGLRAPAEPTQAVLPRSSRPTAPAEMAGRVLEGKYQLQTQIGAGGMGAVYSARRIHIGDEVAVKVLHAHFVAEASAVERFRREARAAAMLRHPSVVAIYDFGEARGDNPAFIVMELVNGVSLRSLLQRERCLTPERAVALMREICAGVGAAHRHNVVHRDIKPDNIIVCAPDQPDEVEKVKVLDFGIAKLRDLAPDQGLTQTGAVLGTPYYMSPEQCRGDALDARSDVYSLGAMLYEMMAGQPPFLAHTITGVVAKHLTETPAPLSRHVPLAPALEDVIMRALAKDPSARQADALAFTRALQQSLHAKPAAALTNKAPAYPTAGASEATVVVPPPQPTLLARPAQTVPPTVPSPRPVPVPVLPPSLSPPAPLAPPSSRPVRSDVPVTPVTQPSTGKGPLFLLGALVLAGFLFAVGVGVWWLQQTEPGGLQKAGNATPLPQDSPVAGQSSSDLNIMTTTTDTGDGYAESAKPLNISRIESAEAILVGGEDISESDLSGLALGELRILRNAIFARHGRTFESPGLQRYYNSRSWYKPDADYSDDRLSETDRVNLQRISEAERQSRAAQATTAQASSQRNERFTPDNTRDDLIETAWVEGVKGPGTGEWIAFTFKPQTIQYIEIYPGYGKSRELFFANHRLKRATLIFSDGTRASLQLFDEPRVQTVALQAPVRSGSLRLIIEEVYAGSKYDDTVISEINWR